LTWLSDDTLSDVASPLPLQPDPGIQGTYAGDYGSTIADKHVTSWVDGRVITNGASQQDAFTDGELVGFAVTSTTPACGSFVSGTAPVDFVVNLTDPVDPSMVQATDLTVNGIPSDSFVLSNNNGTITFTFNTSPIIQQVIQTMHIPPARFGASRMASRIWISRARFATPLCNYRSPRRFHVWMERSLRRRLTIISMM